MMKEVYRYERITPEGVRINVTCKLNKNIAQLNQLVNSDRLKLKINQRLEEIIRPYVPYKEGYLSGENPIPLGNKLKAFNGIQTVSVTPRGIIYHAKYARKQYYGSNANRTRTFHPLATSNWDRIALNKHGKEFYKDVEQLIIEEIKDVRK